MNRKISSEDKEIINFIKNGIKKYGNIQKFAEALGWDKSESMIVRQTSSDIAPNGTRRESRMRNGMMDFDDNPVTLIYREIKRDKKVKNIYKKYQEQNLTKEQIAEDIRVNNHNKHKDI